MAKIETTGTVDARGMLTAQVEGVPAGEYAIALTPLNTAPAIATFNSANTSQFPDIQGHWAQPFITALASAKIILGFPDGTFRPDQPVNRAQFASLITGSFNLPLQRDAIKFGDLSLGFWANNAIQKAYQMGFLTGYPNKTFRPHVEISKAQILTALVNGLQISTANLPKIALGDYYQDATEIPNYAIAPITTATATGMVVNYPDRQQLQPNKAATRAEVAALLYQAIAQTGKMPKIASDYLINPPSTQTTATLSHQREFRGAWITSVWNVNFPSKQGLSAQEQQQELRAILDRLQSLNFNAVIFQVRPEGDALYSSAREPWSVWLTGIQGRPPEPFYDPLEFLVTEGHQRNIEVHAWFNPFRAKTSKSEANKPPHFDALHPEAVYGYGDDRWMDPGLEIVQNQTYEVILDVVRRYNIDGVHIDDYFYPYPITGQDFPDRVTYESYQQSGGTLDVGAWRRENVNRIVKRLSEGIRATKPQLKFGIAPFGIYQPGKPPGIAGLDQFNALYMDPIKWLSEGWVDYLSPQLYWKIEQTKQSYPVLLQWWAENNPQNVHLYIGNNLSRISTVTSSSPWSVEEFENQVKITRESKNKNVLGNIFYHVKPLMENMQNVNEAFKNRLYDRPALVPSLSRHLAKKPSSPKVSINGNTLSWQPQGNAEIRAWSLYRLQGEIWELAAIFPASIRATGIAAGKYGLCAVSSTAVESEGAIVTLT
ncbi:glycoside hydrolase family 10 protein [Spirulina sp. 06S082]|uniref:glycoside hydrolase family 10 protein n=1 Tax=Spirulina sp. 06S082 TaxID=3110248 RepID=UPI002B1F1B67|nr:family 10 glycosylhydrolase [Spirulina sp. 06S082]MEA5467972.1 family 10 glycosylhydrolase [Spirulina sp. 06S082]